MSLVAEMTEKQIKAQAMDEWIGTLTTMWEAIGKPVDEKRLTVYAKQLAIVPLGLLEKAVARAIRNNGQYQTVPTISAIWEAIRKELNQPHMDIEEAIKIWVENSWSRCVIES